MTMTVGQAERFGDYEIVRYFTAGGMADLYLVRHASREDDLILKRIQQRYADHTRVVKMFIDEGRIARTLEHPNIVRTVDVGQQGGQYYIAMEYIAGHDLIAIVRRGVEAGRFVPRPIALAIGAQIATGLSYAHTHCGRDGRALAIVHCDISPGNIVVSWRGTAKIVDFGIARANIMLREAEHVAGKYNYMAPEQIRGEQVDARADLFSLGVILYELLLGRRLFKGKPDAVKKRVLDADIPRPRDVRPDFPERLERILGKLLARDPAHRYPSAAALRSDLRAYLQEAESGWSKRDVALYLRDLFRAPLGGARALAGSEAEELGDNDQAMPQLGGEVEADEDDFVDEPSYEGGEGERTNVDPHGVAADGGAALPEESGDADLAIELEPGDATGETAPAVAPAAEGAALAAGGNGQPAVAVGEAGGTSTGEASQAGDAGDSTAVDHPPAAPPDRTAETPMDYVRSGEVIAHTGAVAAPPAMEPRRRNIEVAIDPTAQVRIAPPAPRRRAAPAGDPPTALVRLPDEERRREAARVSASVEPTKQVRLPGRRRRRGGFRITAGVVVGAGMILVAVLLLILILSGR